MTFVNCTLNVDWCSLIYVIFYSIAVEILVVEFSFMFGDGRLIVLVCCLPIFDSFIGRPWEERAGNSLGLRFSDPKTLA